MGLRLLLTLALYWVVSAIPPTETPAQAADSATSAGLTAQLAAENRHSLVDEVNHAGDARLGSNLFHARHHAGDRIVLDYSIGDTRILQTARLESPAPATAGPAAPIVTRIW
jgi:hypothetical protein